MKWRLCPTPAIPAIPAISAGRVVRLVRGNDQIFLALGGHYWPPGAPS
ncbi:hypothetical protein [Streptomyces sp. PSAA01]|nr:hypothetical protein [Streptomyces sp. PSAA01]MCG0286992.1 hypothetical protein [Streptomyces sp. PSAA01]